jgi:alpha-ketoglutarate-dependent taurine dioxygenase
MRIDLDWDDRQFLLELLRDEEANIASGDTIYADNAEAVEHIWDLIEKFDNDEEND